MPPPPIDDDGVLPMATELPLPPPLVVLDGGPAFLVLVCRCRGVAAPQASQHRGGGGGGGDDPSLLLPLVPLMLRPLPAVLLMLAAEEE